MVHLFLLLALLWLPLPAEASLLHLAGPVPESLGLQAGQLAACPSPAHCVREDWPLADPAAALKQLGPVLAGLPGTRIESSSPSYLHATAESRLFGFIDDLELAADPEAGVLQVRSASRLGDSDLGVNRARVEQLRGALRP
ncbi:DUF1499 domain-containing protein [Synechococcus sp. CS-1325]|uniref:DUF1499 domain-containing protein n=1 Tax=Synechococcus sp. CS-1325 TaxID=2847979 RepID=UPI000DB68897|nr:DUF1499 domain-containing protein [Synechococcus sp. CS-1325]MCT0198376.1 DUF1499 domain-containing protein [Synechococcus sp. CS-1325]PZU97266.1 MAG: DUF1499 domain-containing protein [Cyanobium sp.]